MQILSGILHIFTKLNFLDILDVNKCRRWKSQPQKYQKYLLLLLKEKKKSLYYILCIIKSTSIPKASSYNFVGTLKRASCINTSTFIRMVCSLITLVSPVQNKRLLCPLVKKYIHILFCKMDIYVRQIFLQILNFT